MSEPLNQFNRDVGNLNARAQLRIPLDDRDKAIKYLRIVQGAIERALYILEHPYKDRSDLMDARAVLRVANYTINPPRKRDDEL